MFLLNRTAEEQFALYQIFTIQNVSIKYILHSLVIFHNNYLQYKMFLLNIKPFCACDNFLTFTIQNVSIKCKEDKRVARRTENLQYKMFLLNKFELKKEDVFVVIYNTKCFY